MNSKISDFKLAEFILRRLCKQFGCHFVDLPITFADQNLGPSLVVSENNKKLSKTLFQIVAGYIQRIDHINGSPLSISNEDKISAINGAVASIRDYCTGQMFKEALEGLPTVLTLNRDPFIWIVLRDIICPSYNKPLINMKVVAGQSSQVDAAKLVEEEKTTTSFILGEPDVKVDEENIPFIFVNMQVENYPARLASILHESIKAHGLNPKVVIKELLTKTELSDKFMGIAGMAMVDPEIINDFVMTLGMLIDFDQSFMLVQASDKRIKKAQMGSGQNPTSSHTSFWQLGLIEQMLEPMRGTDWTPYFTMKPFTDALWEKVEAEKRRRGLAELPMELLLRVQSEDYKHDPDQTIQALLDDNRVW